ncbi:dimethylmenaquinone methyltransferase [Leisingera methylohalidivorans DSM 14336]|uniref:Dimethylmenaquinone methyltransferase n=1 Tax=Leisingera methylohalidivorans DSM 14336 TaxID=999552 RepID=V9VNH1_9RHOB|nr:dimethylmenaquinone methyltransferase [Leisingera methylohalidivorans DSM 14336]
MDELRRIDAALARLREGSYGYCRICGDNIADDWLDQRPASPFCKSCAL